VDTEAPPFRHVLAATDGSEAASAAVDQAVALARLFDARLTLLRVVAFPAWLASPYIPHTAEMDREVVEQGKQEAERALAARAEQIDGGADTVVEVAFQPARGILTVAERLGCDLVAVGTDRRTVLGRAVLGSTADKVIRGSPIPVLVGHASD
jgi:nucleotide-binding universal stress UspA family protein